MDGDNRPKRKVRTGLIKLFTDALDEAMEKDPVQHIKDSYHQRLDNEYNTELGINPSQGGRPGDPIQRIRESYDKRLDDEGQSRVSISSLEDELRDEPIRNIKEGFADRTNYINDIKYNIDSLEEARRDEPVQHIRDTYDKILNTEYTEPTAAPDVPQKENNNNASVDPFQRIKEAYDQMFDDKESKNREEQSQKSEQLPWWKKFF